MLWARHDRRDTFHRSLGDRGPGRAGRVPGPGVRRQRRPPRPPGQAPGPARRGRQLPRPPSPPPATGATGDLGQPVHRWTCRRPADGGVIGPYKLVEVIGEGGMGTVWLAQQQEPVKRLVALKVIKAGMDSRQVLARFEAERQALALMDHPNIAKVLDAGATPDGPAVLRHGAGQGRPDHQVLRRAAAHPAGAAGTVRPGLPGGPARPPEGGHPPRPQAVERPGRPVRRPAGAEGDRLRRRQGDRPAAHREDAGHRAGGGGRDAGVHVARSRRS